MALCGAALLPAAAATGRGLEGLDTRRIDAAFAAYDRPDSPGCACGVVSGGTIAYARGYGLASLEHAVPITPATVFDLGSTSKQITSAAVALLVAEGRLSLDDDIRKHLPEIPDYGKRITVRRLLDHTSGLRDYTDVLSLDGHHEEDVTTTAQGLAALVRQKGVNFAPGAEFRYTNSGHFLASILVQRVSGQSLREFAQARLFTPLGMQRTTYFDDHTQVVPGRATGYSPRSGGGFKTAMSDWEQVGDGGVQSSVEELALWATNLETGAVGGPRLVELLHTPGRLADGTPIAYGLGLFLRSHRGLRLVEHGGAWAGYRANLLRIPARRLAAIVLCNLSSADTHALGLAALDAALDALPPAEGGVPTEAGAAEASLDAATAGLAGRYFNEHLGDVARVEAKAGRLLFQEEIELLPDAPLRFRARDRSLGITFAPGGLSMTLTDLEEGARPLNYQRAKPGDGKPLPAGGREEYTGLYRSGEIEAPCAVALGKDGLALRCGDGEDTTLEPLAPDLFDLGWGIVRFRRDAARRVTALSLTNRGLVDFSLRRTAPAAPPAGRKPS